jgi:hypothetical protein
MVIVSLFVMSMFFMFMFVMGLFVMRMLFVIVIIMSVLVVTMLVMGFFVMRVFVVTVFIMVAMTMVVIVFRPNATLAEGQAFDALDIGEFNNDGITGECRQRLFHPRLQRLPDPEDNVGTIKCLCFRRFH